MVGDPSLVRVHVHTHDPQQVMDYCAGKGKLKDIINDNMDTQVEKFKNKGSRKTESGRKTQLSNSMITP